MKDGRPDQLQQNLFCPCDSKKFLAVLAEAAARIRWQYLMHWIRQILVASSGSDAVTMNSGGGVGCVGFNFVKAWDFLQFW